MRGGSIARVLATKSYKAKEGDYVFAWSGWTEVSTVAEVDFSVIDLPEGTRITDGIGAAG